LIETKLLEEKDARLEFLSIEAPQKHLYLKLVGGCRGVMETLKCRNYQSTTNKMTKETQV
jgi:hypothetical protein